MECTVTILKNGLATSVQDFGRPQQQQLGIPLGGAADKWAMQCANWLVGNSPDCPVIECTLFAPILQFSAPCTIALCGADLSFTINGVTVPINTSIQIQAGDKLHSGKPLHGCRTYLAIGGEWKLTTWQGSVSPLANGSIPVSKFSTKGDAVSILVRDAHINKLLPQWAIKQPVTQPKVRFVSGPDMAIEDEELELKVLPNSNRMGLRCEGKKLLMSFVSEMISSAVLPGTIQLTPNGQVIILGVDAQTMGGYPRIGQVIQADLWLLAQLVPNTLVTLKKVSIAEAIEAFKAAQFLEQKLWSKTA